ncbi:MAG: DUF4360 domain-containing protein [Polyangiales bacterium]
MFKVPHARRAPRALSLGVAAVIGLSMTACDDASVDEVALSDDALDVAEQQQQGRDRDGRDRNDDRNDGRGNQRDAGRGAAQQDAGRGGQQQQQPPPQTQQPTRPVGAPVAGSDAQGGFFAAVNARGTGCPAGSWVSSISSDGQVFTMTFSAYEIRVNVDVQNSTRDCILGLKLQSPRGLQFSLPTIYYGGYAFLENGVSARQTASYTFRNSGTTVNQPASQLRGPYDSDFLFTHGARTVNDRAWSPCGYDRVVNVNTQITMQNGNPRASGYMNLAAIDGEAKLVLRLAWRGCRANGPAPNFTEPSTASVARSAAPTTATIDGEQWSTPAVVDN